MTKTLKEVFHKYLDTASSESMDESLCVLDSFVEEMRKHHVDEVEELVCEIEEVLSPYLTKEEAEEIVSEFINKDGSTGPHWTIEETTEVAKTNNISLDGCKFKCADWFVVLNMIYSDHFNQAWGVEVYVDLAKDFLNDKDFDKPGKAKWYFTSKEAYLK